MLKITKTTEPDAITLTLEGKILQPWVEEVRSAWTEGKRNSSRVNLDLRGITFMDAAGIDLIRSLVDAGAHLQNCSNFVSELLQRETNS